MPVLRKRFKQPLDAVIAKFIASVQDDQSLISSDIDGSMAHCAMLAEQGLISREQAENILHGLATVKDAAADGSFQLTVDLEDVHMNVETALQKIIGKDALRLHTARSRNDQVALDFRLYVVSQVTLVVDLIKHLQQALLCKAAENSEVVMPGYTHLQRAQPILFAHALLAFFEMLERDCDRFAQSAKRASVSPLGAGAQAGSSLPIDPHSSAAKLGFAEVFSNSIDAVMDRDFAAEFLMAASLLSTHLSQLAETLIIWNTAEFGFIQFCDSVTTSSSLMPQKKNPDPVEIVRGKTGIAIGELVNLLVTLKGLPLGYNRDLQESKTPVIRVAAEVAASLQAMQVVVAAIEVNAAAMQKAASDPQLMATDLVEYLVAKGVPFREAHEAVAFTVQMSEEENLLLSELPLTVFKQCCPAFESDVFEMFDPVRSALSKKSHGGTGSAAKVLLAKQALPHKGN